jgi:hypothetical protein
MPGNIWYESTHPPVSDTRIAEVEPAFTLVNRYAQALFHEDLWWLDEGQIRQCFDAALAELEGS